jgi:hypothetical protein
MSSRLRTVDSLGLGPCQKEAPNFKNIILIGAVRSLNGESDFARNRNVPETLPGLVQ